MVRRQGTSLEEYREQRRAEYAEKREDILARQRNYAERNRERLRAWKRDWTAANREKARETHRRSRLKLRLEVLTAYSTGKPICRCCGEDDPRFLTLDHVNDDGGAHRKAMREAKVRDFYQYLKMAGFPQEPALAVGCANCNLGRSWNGGLCPHDDPLPIG